MSFSTEKLRTLLNPNGPTPLPATAPASLPSSATSLSSPASPSPLLDTLLRTYELPVDSSALEQIELCADASVHCLQAGSRRKAAFFLIQAAGLYQELHQYAACTTLLQAIGRVYKLELTGAARVSDDEGGSAGTLAAARRYERGESDEPWVALQRSILEHLIYAAHKSNSQLRFTKDVLLAAYSILHLLAALHMQLDAAYQASLSASLRSLSSALPIDTRVECMGLPVLHCLTPVPLKANQQPHRESDSANPATDVSNSRMDRISTQESDVFLFSPGTENNSRHRALATLHYCLGETLQVEVVLSNPLRVPLQIQSIRLLSEGVPLVIHSTHITLQPEEMGRRVVLTGRPGAVGTLKLLGCAIRCFNLASDHLVDSAGVGLSSVHVSPVHDNSYSRIHPLSNVHELRIEPTLPLLDCRVRLRNAESDRMSFLTGERGEVVLGLTNSGSLPIADIDVRIQAIFVQNSEQQQITYYSEEELHLEQQQTTAKQSPPTLSPQFNVPDDPPSSTQLPASSSFSSANAAKRIFDFNRSVTLSRRNSQIDSAPSSPQATAAVVRPVQPPNLPSSPMSWNTGDLAGALPLLPGQHIDVVVQVNAIPECCGLEFKFCYAEVKPSRSYRLLQDKVHWQVLPALAVKHVAALPTSQQTRASTSTPPSLPLHLLLDIINRADIDLVLRIQVADPAHTHKSENSQSTRRTMRQQLPPSGYILIPCILSTMPDSPSAQSSSSTTRIQRQSSRRLLLPMSFMTFGERADRQLLTLASSKHRGADHSALLGHCLHKFRQRVRLSWESGEVVSGTMRRGQLTPALSLSLHQLAQLLAPPVIFSCECDNKQSEMTDSQHIEGSNAALSPAIPSRSSSISMPTKPGLVSPTSLSSTAPISLLEPTPLVRNVSTVLMADKLVRSMSNSSPPPLQSPAANKSVVVSSSRGAPLLLGFGPHRVPVGAFVRVAVDVRNNSNVLGTLSLQLHVQHIDGSEGGQRYPLHAVVLTAGCLSPLLPPIAASGSVRHEWSVCCLAKGQFAFRLSAQACSALPPALTHGQETAAAFAQLRAAMSRVQTETRQPNAGQQNLSVRASTESKQATDESNLAISHFPCPQLLLFDAYV